MKQFAYTTIIATALFLSGCSAPYTKPTLDMKPPKYVQQMPSREVRSHNANAGSLFGRGENPLFADRKAMSEHDIVTVVINESANTSSSSDKSLSKNSNSALGGGVTGYNGESDTVSGLVDKLNNVTDIGFEGGSDSSFQGSGSTSRSEEFTTTVSARIIKVMQNGNYFIAGSRELLIQGEKQTIKISGVIRPYDINQNNEVDSKHISDAKVEYDTRGDLAETTRQGWGSEIVESIWPF